MRSRVDEIGRENGGAPLGHVRFMQLDAAYALDEREEPVPPAGATVDSADGTGAFVVLKVGASPYPNDRRPCAYLVRE